MSGIKYYQLTKGEEMPDEFCVVRDVDGEPSEYTFYVPEAENAELREQMERLVTLLRVDCDIDASWDGLRRFWSIGLTENGCLMRDRACKAEAENAKLREELANAPKCETCEAMLDCDECLRADGSHKERRRLSSENAKLRELVRDWRELAVVGANSSTDWNRAQADLERRMRELEVDDG